MARKVTPAPIALAAVVVAVGAASVAAQPGLAARAKTKVTISSSVPAFHGKVRSRKPICRNGRRVELLRKRPGRGPRALGTDRTTGSGRWEIPVRNLKSGAYFAKAAPKARAGCPGARSKTTLID